LGAFVVKGRCTIAKKTKLLGGKILPTQSILGMADHFKYPRWPAGESGVPMGPEGGPIFAAEGDVTIKQTNATSWSCKKTG